MIFPLAPNPICEHLGMARPWSVPFSRAPHSAWPLPVLDRKFKSGASNQLRTPRKSMIFPLAPNPICEHLGSVRYKSIQLPFHPVQWPRPTSQSNFNLASLSRVDPGSNGSQQPTKELASSKPRFWYNQTP